MRCCSSEHIKGETRPLLFREQSRMRNRSLAIVFQTLTAATADPTLATAADLIDVTARLEVHKEFWGRHGSFRMAAGYGTSMNHKLENRLWPLSNPKYASELRNASVESKRCRRWPSSSRTPCPSAGTGAGTAAIPDSATVSGSPITIEHQSKFVNRSPGGCETQKEIQWFGGWLASPCPSYSLVWSGEPVREASE